MTEAVPRSILRALLDAAIASAQPSYCVPPHLPSPPKGRTIVVGAGKAAAAMARAVEDHYPSHIEGVVVCPYGAAQETRMIRVIEAAHPIADANSVAAARSILDALAGLSRDDLVIALISGGGSALMALPPPGVTLEEKQGLVGALMRSGAPIEELNATRAALSEIKGGGLARAIAPAHGVALIISDVVGDDPALIASGPTIDAQPDPGRVRGLLDRHAISIPPGVEARLRYLEGENGSTDWTHAPVVDNRLIATPAVALEAAAECARSFGLTPIILSDAIEGDPEEAARNHIAMAQEMMPGTVLLSGGELTSRVRGDGKGGPNLEFCLRLVSEGLPKDVWAIACDTDGRDGNSGVGGAIVTPDSAGRGIKLGLLPEALITNSSSLDYFSALGDVIDTGWTGTNVNDFRALLRIST